MGGGGDGQRHAPAALPPGKTRYPLYRKLGGPQGRSGWVLYLIMLRVFLTIYVSLFTWFALYSRAILICQRKLFLLTNNKLFFLQYTELKPGDLKPTPPYSTCYERHTFQSHSVSLEALFSDEANWGYFRSAGLLLRADAAGRPRGV